MYIFNEAKDFLGTAEVESDNSFASLFFFPLRQLCLLKQIRTKLGKQGYLLDHYLSIFFDAAYQLRPQDALDDASEADAHTVKSASLFWIPQNTCKGILCMTKRLQL